MNIEDEGIIINISHYSETSAIVTVLTSNHGKMSGLFKGAFKKNAGIIQLGNYISFYWRANNENNLGSFYSIDLIRNHFVLFMNDVLRLYALQSACSLCYHTLPDKSPCPTLFSGFYELLNSLDIDHFIVVYVFWEMGLLKNLGFELDLSKCTVCNTKENLKYVSPKSGKAVCAEHGEPYKDKIIPLPEFMTTRKEPPIKDIIQALNLVGYFLETKVFNGINKTTPEARNRFIDKFSKIDE